jgi:hypothetical protein
MAKIRSRVTSLTGCSLLLSALETVETEQPVALANSCSVTGIDVYPISKINQLIILLNIHDRQKYLSMNSTDFFSFEPSL